MKLKKAVLCKHLYGYLKNKGYELFSDSNIGADVLFIKRIDKSLFLSLGVVISRLYDARFTASFYLSKTTRWGSLWGDIPKESYRRIGEFLSDHERKRFLDSEHSAIGVIDSWWGITDNDFDSFFEVVNIAEQRFLKQKDLRNKIEESKEIKELATLSSLVLLMIEGNEINGGKYDYIPPKSKSDIDQKWFKAAEEAIKKTNGILNKNTVLLLAADAWRQWVVAQSSPI